MAGYTEFDASETEAYGARIEAEQALRDHQPVAQTVDPSEPLKIFELTVEWAEEDERLKEAAQAAYAAWKAAVAANPRHQR